MTTIESDSRGVSVWTLCVLLVCIGLGSVLIGLARTAVVPEAGSLFGVYLYVIVGLYLAGRWGQ